MDSIWTSGGCVALAVLATTVGFAVVIGFLAWWNWVNKK